MSTVSPRSPRSMIWRRLPFQPAPCRDIAALIRPQFRKKIPVVPPANSFRNSLRVDTHTPVDAQCLTLPIRMMPPNAARQVDRVARLDPGRRARAHPANTESVHADLIYTHASPHGEDLVVV